MYTDYWSILKNINFRNFWLTNLLAYFAVWMQGTIAAIAITQMSHSAFVSSLSQWATTMPIFVFGFLAGILGDKYHKFTLMSIFCTLMSLIVLVLCFLGYLHKLTPPLIILGSFLFATGTAFRMPVSQAVTSHIVEKHQIKNAAILNNLGFNIMRAIGPAIAGILMAVFTIQQSFFVVAIILIIVSLSFNFQRGTIIAKQRSNSQPNLLNILRMIAKSKVFTLTGIDALFIFASGNVVWALLPFFAKYKLGMGTIGQSGLVSLIGAGAIMTGLLLPLLIKHLKHNYIILSCYVIPILSLIILSKLENFIALYVALIIFGFSWANSVAYFNGIIQSSFDKKIITKIVATYLMIMYLSQSIGSVVFGYFGSIVGITASMLIAAMVLFCGYVIRCIVEFYL